MPTNRPLRNAFFASGGFRKGTDSSQTPRWRKADSKLVWGFSCQVVFSVYCQFFVRRCVQVRLACSAGGSPAGVKVRARSLDSGGDGNRTFEAYRQDLPRGEHESPGCIKRERIVASKK